MARRTTTKTSKTRSAATSGKSRAADASDTPEPAPTEQGVDLPEGQSVKADDTATSSSAPVPDDVVAETTVSLSEGPSQMGEDTAEALDDTAQDPSEAPDTDPAPASTEGVDDVPGTAQSSEPATPEAPKPDVETPPIAPAPTPAAAPKGSGVLPLILGGAVAAALGYGAHFVQSGGGQDVSAQLGAVQTELAQLRADVAEGPDVSALQAQIAALSANTPDLAAEVDALQTAIDSLRQQSATLSDVATLQTQIDALQSAPPPEVDLSSLTAAIDRLDGLIAPVPDQIAALQAEVAELRALATERVVAAEAAVDTALATAGLERVRAALVTGDAFPDALDQLDQAGVDVPPALETAASGVQTLEALQDSYGAAARDAIAASLQAAPAESTTERLGNFLRAQVGARSLAPRDGDDADAITSRAAVAVAEGDLAAARAELDALPEAGRDAMRNWLTAVDTRLNALMAVTELSADITTE